jgi:hypothetical protein
MPKTLLMAIDAAVAAALVLALAVVFAFDRKKDIVVVDDVEPEKRLKVEINSTWKDITVTTKPMRLAVTHSPGTRLYDDMGKLLTKLGQGYQYREILLEDLASEEKTAAYDVIFVTCSTHPMAWLDKPIGTGERAGTTSFTINEQAMARVRDNLRRFVGKGGTLYVSDHHYAVLARGFEELIDDAAYTPGIKEPVEARVIDPGLRELIGSNLPLDFKLDGWKPAAFKRSGATVYLEGDYHTIKGQVATAPLLMKMHFPPGGQGGTIIFTSFHNEEQNNEKELQLLRYLVFSAVTEQVEKQLTETIEKGGFEARKQNLLSASVDAPSETKTYHKEKPGRLRFALGWSGGEAQLRLTVTSPAGLSASHVAAEAFTMDVPDAPAGDWTYAVTAVKLPNPNFPFRVTVGEK